MGRGKGTLRHPGQWGWPYASKPYAASGYPSGPCPTGAALASVMLVVKPVSAE
jgi:hypothetical protein